MHVARYPWAVARYRFFGFSRFSRISIYADGVAQQAKREGKLPDITKQLIDYFFGWCLKEMAHDMQVHYAGLDRPARRLLAQVTMHL